MKNSEPSPLTSIRFHLIASLLACSFTLLLTVPVFGQDSGLGATTPKLPKNTVIATVAVGSAPQGIVVTPNTNFVYVANGGSLSLSEIDAKSNTVAATIPLTVSPGALAITPDGSKLYIGNYYANSVSVVDTASNTVTSTVSLSEGPSYLAVTPDGSDVYVLCNYQQGSGIVAIIDTETNQVLSTTINVGGFPQSLVFTADGNTAYEVNDNTTDVSMIDTASKTIVSTLPTKQQFAGGLALLPNSAKLYVTGDSDFVAVINTTTKKGNKIVLPQGISFSIPALTPSGRYLYDPSGNSNSVYMIDTKTNKVVGNPITVGSQPWKIAISSSAKRAYVTNYADGTVSVINIAL
jgi:YVTN family beta-propeller protein